MNDAYLPFVPIKRRTGDEEIGGAGRRRISTLLDFWRWSGSDLLGNTQRGALAEYLVALDLDVADEARDPWDIVDLRTKDGIKVEVKASAYVQSWKQRAYSKLTFGIGKTLAWDPKTDRWDTERRRQADVYVFCVLEHGDQATIAPLDVDQWAFYVLATEVLDRRLGEQKTVGLARIVNLGAERVTWGGIAAAIRRAMD